jgi:pantetheine-phosphate adenylyltransferase
MIDAERAGLYPGTFDPITNGHMDIIGRAARLFDRVVVGVAVNEDKRPLFSLEERVEMVRHEAAAISGCGPHGVIEVRPFSSLLVHFAQEVGARTIIRGLRAVTDFEYEFQMVGMNAKLNPGIETIFLPAGMEHQAIASRLVKEIARLGGDIRKFVSPHVAEQVGLRLNRRAGEVRA